MDNTSVSVTSTVVAALITALATIIAALIPLLYAEFRVKNISVSESLDSLTASIIEFYSNFSIKTARVFSVKEKSAKVIDDIDFTIGVVFVW